MFEKRVGSRAEVMHGTAHHTSGGLTKADLKYNKYGRIVSKAKSAQGKKAYARNCDKMAQPYGKGGRRRSSRSCRRASSKRRSRRRSSKRRRRSSRRRKGSCRSGRTGRYMSCSRKRRSSKRRSRRRSSKKRRSRRRSRRRSVSRMLSLPPPFQKLF
jgi:hypothetical protein